MPELAFIYSIGVCAVIVSLSLLIWFELRTQGSEAVRVLQQNLALIGARWSHGQDNVITMMAAEQKASSHLRSLGLLMLGCAFLSWLGFFFSILIWISFPRVMHKRRSEILETQLSKEKLKTAEEVVSALKNFNEFSTL